MISKVLIANRGEIVARVMKTCREMGIQSVAVYSAADDNAPYLKTADEAVAIGPANPQQSYLNMDAVIEAAKSANADAIHPGYGFLSERGKFAQAVEEAGITWIGPPSHVLRAISSKIYCRKVAHQVDVPVIPGTLGLVESPAQIVDYGNANGWPLLLKLDKGGGGKGIERINGPNEAEEVFKRAASIGKMAFGSGDCYIETLVDKPRHIEVQFLADREGQVVCLGERECSVQRRHQKIIEETPSMVVTDKDRAELFHRTVRFVREIGYCGAGTIEYLRSDQGEYYFMEINARLQVEHPVTEYVTGIDIVKCQILIASGEPMGFTQEDIRFRGSAVEARVYAEDPDTFIPSPGTITALDFPPEDPHIRIDHALENNGTVPPYYDPLLAKVIAWGEDRAAACGTLSSALNGFRVEGVKTTIPVSLKIIDHPKYRAGDIDTGFIDGLLTP